MRQIYFLDANNEYPTWELKKLGELAHIRKGFTPSTENSSYWQGDIPWLSITGFNEKYIKKGNKHISKEALGSKQLVPKGGLVMSFKLTLGKLGILDIPMVTNEAICYLDWKDNSIINEFAFYALSAVDLVPYANQAAAGLTLNDAALKSITIPLPSLLEQEKIAEFLGALDERIALTADKVKLLKEQKAGYLQRVFAQEMVFTDDNGDRYPEWEKKKLGEVGVVTMGQSPDGKSYSEDSNDMVLIQGNADMKNGYIVPRIYTSEPTKTCEAGDIIMSVRAPVGAFAKTDITACLGRGVCAISANDYVYQYLKYHSSIGGWSKLAQGSTFEAVSSTDVKTLAIPLPSLPEQEKIAELFSALDEQIELTENKLTLLKEQKKGYLQGIFG